VVRFVRWLGLPLSILFSLYGLVCVTGRSSGAACSREYSGLYAGVGAMAALSLSSKQKLILAAMLMLCHSLPQEGAIVAQARGKVTAVISARIGTAVAVGLLLSLIL